MARIDELINYHKKKLAHYSKIKQEFDDELKTKTAAQGAPSDSKKLDDVADKLPNLEDD